jgi:hypothetical protein
MTETKDVFQEMIGFYRAYLERNNTFEEFASDVNTLGGTFERCESWIETNRTHATISDQQNNTIARYSLKSIWDEFKSGQTTLFSF